MSDLIDRQDVIDAIAEFLYYPNNWDGMRAGFDLSDWEWKIKGILSDLPSAEPERKKDIIQKFHDYQVEWLKSHYDLESEPQLEEMIVRFLHDTANCYMMEVEDEV